MSEITRHPLCWPTWFPRTHSSERVDGRFGKKSGRGFGLEDLTIPQARQRILKQLGSFTRVGYADRCDLENVIISSNLSVNKDGWLLAKQKKIIDPGVAIYFVLDRVSRCIPCDMYLKPEDNMAAIAATLDALRTVERHGSQMFNAAFSGFDALPAPKNSSARSWQEVLEYFGIDIAEAEKAYKIARKNAHPDHGGNDDEFNEVQEAWQQAKNELQK